MTIARKPRAGLLPLYLKLYDDTNPGLRHGFTEFMHTVGNGLSDLGIELVQTRICRIESEIRNAVRKFQDRNVDCIITLHLAYSPSLEAAEALAGANLPIILMSTTMDHAFGPEVAPTRIMYNHGIHGVMDLANILRRDKCRFQIVAGHVTGSNVIPRTADMVRAACAAVNLGRTRALRIGDPFAGMGDFIVSESVMQDRLGISVDQVMPEDLASAVKKTSIAATRKEMKLDREQFACECPDEVHKRTNRICLGLRRTLEKGGYNAFSMNFLNFDAAESAVSTVPFLEASKAMARGIGYAGEGDVLTAALVGALQRAFGRTSFTEIFCPDWQGESLFLSHMGEINPEVAAGRPVMIEKDFPYTPALNPAIISCALRPGKATFVNLAPGPGEEFSLLVAPVTVLADKPESALTGSIRGWIKPALPVNAFLEAYSTHGGTHHSALVLGDRTEAIQVFAAFVGLPCRLIDQSEFAQSENGFFRGRNPGHNQ